MRKRQFGIKKIWKGKKTVLIGSYHSIQVFRKDNYIAWNLRQFKPRTPGVKVGWYKTQRHFWRFPAFILSNSYQMSLKLKKSTMQLSRNNPSHYSHYSSMILAICPQIQKKVQFNVIISFLITKLKLVKNLPTIAWLYTSNRFRGVPRAPTEVKTSEYSKVLM